MSLWAWKNGIDHAAFRGQQHTMSFGEIYMPNTVAIEQFQPDFLTGVEILPAEPWRAQGVYRWGTAEAHLKKRDGKHGYEYVLEIKSTSIADIQMLYFMIRSGTTWPETSFESEQKRPPFVRRLTKLWKQLLDRVRQAYRRLADTLAQPHR